MIIFDGIIYSLQKNGGISVYFDNIISRVSRFLDVKTSLYLYDDNKKCHPNVDLHLPKKRFLERYRSFLCEKSDESDIFHSTYYRVPLNFNGKIITTVHDFTYEKYSTGLKLWIHKWQKYNAIKKSDIVICVSHNTAKDLLNYCPVELNRIRVIYNGVSSSYYKLDEEKVTTNEVIFVGSRASYKNFQLAVESVSRLSNLTLGIVGGGILTKSELSVLQNLLPSRYTYYGNLSEAKLNLRYNTAYALLYPSAYEGFGIPVIEAMRAGCPVIAVRSSSIPEVAGDAAILVDTPSVSSLVDALTVVSEKRCELTRKGFLQANKFSWEKCFEETLQVYKELM